MQETFMGWQPRRLARLAFVLSCAAIPFRAAVALDPAKALTQYVHTVWRTDDGLPQNSVNHILQTRDGYLWVGTQAGVARFDGVRFTVFDHTNTPALHDDYIDGLVEDGEGTLWIATSNGGVTYFRNGRFFHLDAIGARGGLTLVADADGSMWIGGYGGLLHVRNGKVVRTYTTADGLSGDPVRRLVVDKDRSLWIATVGGLNRLANGRVEAYSTRDGLPSNDVINMYLGSDDTLWVQTQSSQIVRRVAGRFEPWKIQDISKPTTSMLEDRSGNLWFASATEGLFRVNGEQVSRFTTRDGLSSDEVSTLYEDHDGNLWVGTNEGGLDRFHDGSFTTYAREEGLVADQTYAVIEDHAGDIWATTVAGLNRLHQNHVRVFTVADGLPVNSTWSLWEDRQQHLLVGTSGGGVARFDRGRFTQQFPKPGDLPAYMVKGILQDSMGRFWFSTQGGGLVRYVDGQTSLYSRANGLLSNFLYAIAEDRNGTMWVGTSSGLDSIQGGRITSHETAGLSDAVALTLHVDARNVLWVGTFGRGLFRLENGHFTRYTTRQGLPDDTINNILEDGDANLWIGSNKGIFRIARHDLDAVAAGTSKTMQPILFGKADGMKSSETNAGSQPSGWRARDGRLWFPTIRGVVVVDPARISLSDQSRPARVEQLLADEVDIDLAAPVRLAPGTRRLEIRYTAPNLSSPERTRFRYRLEGFDEQWVQGASQRVAQYTNLSPGHYVFHVGASADTGRWGSEEGLLGFDVLPQFYQTWWFRLLEALAGMLLLLGIYRLRVNWLHARAAVLEERQRIAGEIHDSLAQGLSGIVFQTEAALISMERAPGMTATHLVSARDLAKSSLDDARYSVLNISPPIADQKSLLESLSAMARQLTGGRVDELDIHSSGTAWTVPAEAKHHVVLITQEAVSNAIQHGNARTISISLTFAIDALHLTVSDDGVGFATEISEPGHARGYGMRNMRHRSASLGARLEVSSGLGKGTRIILCIPRPGALARLWRRLSGNNIARIDT
jgi:ligand-binding sensor domain-containing protein/signal transduction histidine kinase